MPISRHAATTLGARLRDRRKALGMTVRQLMEKSGAYLHPSYYSHVENGRQTPSLHALRQVCAALEIDLNALLADSGIDQAQYHSQKFTPDEPGALEPTHATPAGPQGSFKGLSEVLEEAERAEKGYQWEDLAAYLRVALQFIPAADPRRPKTCARLALALAWSQAFKESVEEATRAGALIAASEGNEEAAHFMGRAAEALLEAGGKQAAWTLAERGMPYVGQRRGLPWIRLATIDIERREADDLQHPGVLRDSAERREMFAAVEALDAAEREQLSELGWKWGTDLSRARILRDLSDQPGLMLTRAGEFRACIAMYQRQVERAAERHQPNLGAISSALLAEAHIALGEFEPARMAFRRAIELGARLASSNDASLTLAMTLFHLRFARGEGWDELENATEGFLRQLGGANSWATAVTQSAAAHVYARRGRLEEAQALVAAVLPAIEQAEDWAPYYPVMICTAVDACWLIPDVPEETLAILERNIEEKILAPDLRSPMVDGRRAMGLIHGLRGERDAASKWFARAYGVLDQQGARPLRTITLYDEARLYLESDEQADRERGAELLRRALADFEALDLDGWARQARAEAP